MTRFKSVHPGRWELDQSAGIQRDGEAQMAASFYFPVRRLSEPRALFFELTLAARERQKSLSLRKSMAGAELCAGSEVAGRARCTC